MEFDNLYSEGPVSAVSNFWPFSESTFCREIPSRGEDNHAPLYQAPQDITARHHCKTSLQNHRTGVLSSSSYLLCHTSTGPRKKVAEPTTTNADILHCSKKRRGIQAKCISVAYAVGPRVEGGLVFALGRRFALSLFQIGYCQPRPAKSRTSMIRKVHPGSKNKKSLSKSKKNTSLWRGIEPRPPASCSFK
jgi:hypothetical protein